MRTVPFFLTPLLSALLAAPAALAQEGGGGSGGGGDGAVAVAGVDAGAESGGGGEGEEKVSLTGPTPIEAGAETGHQAGARQFSFKLSGDGSDGVGFAVFTSNDSAIGVELELDLHHDEEANTGGFALGPSYVKYLLHGQVSPYTRGALKLAKAKGVSFGKGIGVALGGAFGVEYSFNRRISLAGEIGIAMTFANEFKNIDGTAGTGGLLVNFYWL